MPSPEISPPVARVLGIDPGLQVTGYAVLEACPPGPRVCEAGIIRSAEGRATTDMAQRVRILYDGIVEVLEQFRPGVVVVVNRAGPARLALEASGLSFETIRFPSRPRMRT